MPLPRSENAAIILDGQGYGTHAGMPGSDNSFTIEFCAKPSIDMYIPPEDNTTWNGSYWMAIMPPWYGGGTIAGAGVAVGNNCIAVAEYGDGFPYYPLVYPISITEWTHIAVVYDSKTPKLYVNGVLVHTGLTSTKTTVRPG